MGLQVLASFSAALAAILALLASDRLRLVGWFDYGAGLEPINDRTMVDAQLRRLRHLFRAAALFAAVAAILEVAGLQ